MRRNFFTWNLVLAFGVAATALVAMPQSSRGGTVGATSNDMLMLSMALQDLARISGVDDIGLTPSPWPGTGDVTGDDPVCVWTSTGDYNITATGDGASMAFTLSGAVAPVPYSVSWADDLVDMTGTALTTNTVLTGQTSSASADDCGGGDTARVLVRITEADLEAAQQPMSGTTQLTGMLTLVVAPE